MNYFEIYKEIWDFHKRHSAVSDDDAYWQSVIDESNGISKKYNNNRFVKDLLIAVISELERVSKERRKT